MLQIFKQKLEESILLKLKLLYYQLPYNIKEI